MSPYSDRGQYQNKDMFSFFRSSKKASPAESPEHSDASLSANIGDEYVMIDPRGRPQSDPTGSAAGMYPSLGPAGVGPRAWTAGGDASGKTLQRQPSEAINYLQDVPFKLSPLIRAAGDTDPTEVWGFEVDQILANMTRALDLCAED